MVGENTDHRLTDYRLRITDYGLQIEDEGLQLQIDLVNRTARQPARYTSTLIYRSLQRHLQRFQAFGWVIGSQR